MTLQEAKEIVAKQLGFPNWNDYMIEHKPFDMVCELYAESKWEEGCQEQRKSCAIEAHYHSGHLADEVYHRVLGTETPPFKP